jgi:hypothetical protein
VIETTTGSGELAYDWKTELPGVFSRHADSCPVRDGGEDSCGPLGYRASVRDWQTNRRTVSPMFETAVEAVTWQRDQLVSETPERDSTVGRANLGALIDEYLQAAEDGLVRDPTGERYTREGLRALRGALSYAESELGSMNVQDIRRRHVQSLVDQLNGSGVVPARVTSVIAALADLYTYAIRRELVGFSPVVELELPQTTNGVPKSVPVPPQAPVPAPVAAPAAAAPVEPQPPNWTTGPLAAAPQVGPPWTPHSIDAYGHTSGELPQPPQAPPPQAPPPQMPPPQTPPPPFPPPAYPQGYPGTYPPPYDPAYATSRQFAPPPTPVPYGYESGSFTGLFGQPTQGGNPTANYDATAQERWLWWTVRIVVIVFVLIALVLVAESV